MMENNSAELSFRGKAIPEIMLRPSYQLADDNQVINKVSSMTQEQRAQLKIDAVHYDDYRLSEVKLSTGDIIPVETAIALVDNSLIDGYSTGTTAYGGKTLRSKPATSKEAKTRMRDLPRF